MASGPFISDPAVDPAGLDWVAKCSWASFTLSVVSSDEIAELGFGATDAV